MVFLAFAVGTWLAVRRGKSANIAPNDVMDLVVWILVSSIAGARLTYVVGHWDEFRGRWLDIISPVQSDGSIGIAGLVVLGGVAAAIPVSWWFLKHRGISFGIMADVVAPSVALGFALGRVGCFLNGCCYGHPTDVAWAMVFPETCIAGAAYPGVPIHPTQLYDAAYNLVIFSLLLWWTPRKRFNGELFALLIMFYGIGRTVVEAFREYSDRFIPFHIGTIGVTYSMLTSLAMVAVGVAVLLNGYRAQGRIEER